MFNIEEIITLTNPELLLLYEAFQSKWQRLIKPVTFEKFCQLYDTVNSEEQLYRVLVGGELAGVFGLSGHFSNRKVSYNGKKKLSDWRWYLGIELLKDKIQANECYVSFITISESYRGQSLGSECLAYIEKLAKGLAGIDTVTLFVATDNQRAVSFYQQNDYGVINQLQSWLTSYFLGEKKWLKMTKKVGM